MWEQIEPFLILRALNLSMIIVIVNETHVETQSQSQL